MTGSGKDPVHTDIHPRHLIQSAAGGNKAVGIHMNIVVGSRPVGSHDLLAHGALMQCRNMGLRVPEDISILGFGDQPLCRFTLPPLTTIRQDRAGIGRSAFCALSSQLEGVSLSTFLLHPELIRRASCVPPAPTPPQLPIIDERG